MVKRDEQKAEYEDYRERATRCADSINPKGVVRVRHDAQVQTCEGGAYVDAVIWIPKKSC